MEVPIAYRAQSPMPIAALKAHGHLMPLTGNILERERESKRGREKRRREGCLIFVIYPSCENAYEGEGDRLIKLKINREMRVREKK